MNPKLQMGVIGMKQIIITHQLNLHQQAQVSHLFYEAFPLKVKYLWFHAQTKDQAVKLLSQSIQFEQGIYATSDEKVVGFLGYNVGKKAFTPANHIAFRNVFPPIVATWRFFLYKFYLKFHLYPENVMHIDPIVVIEEARGKGIGRLLLTELEQVAKNKQITRINLEVVDTNPSAQKLYERIGYVIQKELKSGPFTVHAGFRKVIFMQKCLQVSPPL
ncbi:GNAT family N-acetyltransferase [Paenibacillus sp. PCH8]|uniref:GNAT family N-acetyltransferase n=1 Tax=Paenibacillus sp. PCH8 TaxID=2066524 RepID=UPI0015E36551|nr:GNAT family N-acetyltransferase [Paenibacillus sp. PCH8]